MKKILLFIIMSLVFHLANAQFNEISVEPSQMSVGIWIVYPDSTLAFINPIKYKKIKGTGGMASAFTMGIAKIKVKAQYNGNTANNKVKVGDKFIFKFGNVPTHALTTHYMFSSSYSMRNFSLCKFDVKKNYRELTSAEVSAWTGMDMGNKESEDVKFSVGYTDIGVFEVIVTDAKPGEYCFIFSDQGSGAFQSVFDFSVEQ